MRERGRRKMVSREDVSRAVRGERRGMRERRRVRRRRGRARGRRKRGRARGRRKRGRES